ncbi:MAG: penicillin-binding protein 2 [Bacteroides sp.]|nr:penicillin-binding protein 2 [Bacteroides sp.]MCM1084792.1 penicillin-binding protein 2 [Bacteroides sp.]
MKRTNINRGAVIVAIFLAVAFIYWIRLFQLQIVDSRYKLDAESNAIRNKVQYPGRGLIYDRNGKILVYNEAVYDLMIIPGQAKDIDWALLAELLEITEEGALERYKKARAYSRYAHSVFEKQISKEVYGKLQEYLYKFPGFYVQSRTLRRYPKPIAAHVLGDVGEVSESEIARNPYYKMGDYIGKNGLEKYYEEQLRGHNGVKVVMVDVLNREKGSYKDGIFDTAAVSGQELYTTLDAGLQAYAEELMVGKRGSIVAIEPATGEVLALVSAPTYDPNLLVGRIRSNNYAKLLNDEHKPLFNRALMAYYPPGSIFKLPQALIGMQEKVITPYSGFACEKYLVGCHNHPDALCVAEGVRMSCNPYFYQVFRRIIMQGKDPNRFVDSRLGLEKWDTLMRSFGLGTRLGIDQMEVKAGLIPNAAYYDRYYGRNQWAFSTIYSLSIGQGEIGLIPLQMANLASIMANRGYYITPHLVRAIGEELTNPRIDTARHYTAIDRKYFDPVVEGMYGAVHLLGGTARRAKIDSIVVCGKTGTSENPHGKDHAVFIGFAPKDNPRIAISVFLENSGFGGTWAAPTASLLIERYLTGKISRKWLESQVKEFTVYTPENL